MGQKFSCLQCADERDATLPSDNAATLRIRNVNANLLAAPGRYRSGLYSEYLAKINATMTVHTIVQLLLCLAVAIAISECKVPILNVGECVNLK